ncbi:hypothetical protein L207DRAFT_568200 [Hyaloscypha variabilis F]|uniref:Uncharacterized protein n=1 Tax=Hyaloscypha variabilis (strain UAMH 11265 / GT02V1 / F) TaxID=1149755 RepID=A0A2J6RF20_HYAVF|nr:hypothetical protein L207DRAFT_574198 [Hyaloscypha variabilis F]PMD37122.1 hypothetical protein L207DRAFT_568200 [Hyaloscypha variabilis F]
MTEDTMNQPKHNLRKSTRARQPLSQATSEKLNRAMISIPSDAPCPTNSSKSPIEFCSEITSTPAQRAFENTKTAVPGESKRQKVLGQPKAPAKDKVLKPDSEVSATTMARRNKKRAELAARERDKETRERRILELQENGVDRRPGPCFECADRGIQCIVSQVPDPNARSNKCLECYKSNGRRLCGDRVKELQPPAPAYGISAHRDKVLNRNLLVDVGGEYYNEKLVNLYKQMGREERNQRLALWINSSEPGIASGELVEKPCYSCAKTGSVCRKIKFGSLAWRISPKTTRCSTCLKGGNHLSECRSCRPVTDEEWSEIRLEATTALTSPTGVPTTDFQVFRLAQHMAGTLHGLQTTKIPLKGAHEIPDVKHTSEKPTDWRKNQTLQDLRRQSARFIRVQNLEQLERGLCGLEDLETQMQKMYESIRHLSNTSIRLSFTSASSPMPFTPSNLEAFANFGASEPGPSIISSIAELIHISPESSTEQYYTRIEELGLSTLSLRKVISAVASMTLWYLVFQYDPFNSDARLDSVVSMLEAARNNSETIAQLLEFYRLSRLEKEEELQNNLQRSREMAGHRLWEILRPLLLLDMENASEDAVADLQQQCSEIARIACQLNAHMKAKYAAHETFWPKPGDRFDPSQMIFMTEAASSTAQTVRIALCFGILTKASGSTPTVQIKSMVDAFS